MPRFIIEARNILYERVGLVENYTNFEAIIRHNAVGSWSLTVPGGAPEVAHLQPGNGIIVRIEGQDEIAFSGPLTGISRNWDENDQGAGSVTVSGVTDEQLLFERVTYPIPANDLNNQTDDRNIVISSAAYLMEYLVRKNAGAEARPERKYLELDVTDSPTLGGIATVSTRFEVLGEKCQEIGNSHNIGFRLRQGLNNRLLFETFAPVDRSALIFGRPYGNLQAYSYDVEAPTATRAIFACQGEGKDRYFTDAIYDLDLSETFDDRDPRISYLGDGVDDLDIPAAFRGTVTRLWYPDATGGSGSPGRARFTFTGTGFRVRGSNPLATPSDNNYNLDFEPNGHIYTIPASLGPRAVLLEIGNLPYGQHHLELSGRYGMYFDFVEVLDERVTADWRRNSERFYDRRDIPVAWNAAHTSLIDPSDGTPADPAVYGALLDQAALEAWEENGPKATLSMSPIDTELVKYGRDYRVGDVVTVDIDGTLFTEVLREVRLTDGDEGPRITPTIGDSRATTTPTLYKTVRRLWSKVRKLEVQ